MNLSKQELSFHGTGQKLFALQLVNILLSIITLGIYYPWAKAAYLRYSMSETEFAGTRFVFHGTGFEMFKGMIIGLLVIGGAYALCGYLVVAHHPFIGGFLLFFFMLLIIPYAIHSSMQYRTSRTSWRGIHFGYRGDLKQLMNLSVKGIFLTILTLGIYGAWYAMELRSYVLGHVRIGSVEMKYKGKGGKYFTMNLLGYFLTAITFGIYGFWWMKDQFNYYVDNLVLEQNGKEIRLKSNATGLGFAKMFVINISLILFTLGIATPWAVVNLLKFTFANVEFLDELDLDAIQQTEAEYKNAAGEDLSGMLDLGIV